MFSGCIYQVITTVGNSEEPKGMCSQTNLFPWSNQLAAIGYYRQLRGKCLAAREQGSNGSQEVIEETVEFPYLLVHFLVQLLIHLLTHLFVNDIQLRTS